MSKRRPITFNKPEDPSFLKQIKASIGYKEGPTVDTKRQKLEQYDSDDEDQDSPLDSKPQVVVLRAGDLTEAEAELEKQRLLREEAEKPADLSQRVVFKKPTKAVNPDVEADSKEAPSCADTKQKNKKEKKAPKPAPSKLSFADEEEPEEEF